MKIPRNISGDQLAKLLEVYGELELWLSQPGPVADEDVRMGLKRWVPEYEPARH